MTGMENYRLSNCGKAHRIQQMHLANGDHKFLTPGKTYPTREEEAAPIWAEMAAKYGFQLGTQVVDQQNGRLFTAEEVT